MWASFVIGTKKNKTIQHERLNAIYVLILYRNTIIKNKNRFKYGTYYQGLYISCCMFLLVHFSSFVIAK